MLLPRLQDRSVVAKGITAIMDSLADDYNASLCSRPITPTLNIISTLLNTKTQTSVAPPGPSKLVQSTTADEVDQEAEEDEQQQQDSESGSEDEDDDEEDDEEAEQDGDASMATGTPGKKMTARQQEKAAEKKLKAAQRSAKKVGSQSTRSSTPHCTVELTILLMPSPCPFEYLSRTLCRNKNAK